MPKTRKINEDLDLSPNSIEEQDLDQEQDKQETKRQETAMLASKAQDSLLKQSFNDQSKIDTKFSKNLKKQVDRVFLVFPKDVKESLKKGTGVQPRYLKVLNEYIEFSKSTKE